MDSQATDPTSVNQPVTPPPTKVVPPTVDQLATWPGAFGIFKTSSAAVRLNLGTLALIYVGSLILSIIFGLPHIPVVGVILSLMVSAVTTVAYAFTQLAGVHGERVDIGQALRASWPLAVQAFLLNLLTLVIVVISFLLLIIPGLIIAPRLVLATYFLVDQKLSPVAALKASWETTKGHVGKVWGIIGVSILMILPVITIIGIIATIYLLVMYSSVLACLYVFIKGQQSVGVPSSTVSPTTPPVVLPTV